MAIQAAMKEKKETGKEEFAQVTSDSVMTMLQRLEGQIEEAEEKEINLAEDLEKAKRASAFMRAKMSELMTTLDKLGLEQIVTRQPYDDEIRKALAKVSLTRLQREGATDEQIETLITQRASWQDRMKIEDCLPAEKKAAIEVRRVFGIPQPRKSAKPASGKKKEPVKASGGSSGSPGTAKKTVVVKSSKEGAKPVAKKSAKPASGKAVALPVIEPVEGTQRAEVDETLAPDKYGTLSKQDLTLAGALHRTEGASDRWKILVRAGATDTQIREAIAHEWHGYSGGVTGPDGYCYKNSDGKNLRIWIGRDRDQAPSLEEQALIDRVRGLLHIPKPAEKSIGAGAKPASGEGMSQDPRALKIGDRVRGVAKSANAGKTGLLVGFGPSHLFIQWDGSKTTARVPLEQHVNRIEEADIQSKGASDERAERAQGDPSMFEMREADSDDAADGARDAAAGAGAADMREVSRGSVQLADEPTDKRGGGKGQNALSYRQWFSTFRTVYETEARKPGRKIPAQAEPRDVRVHALWGKYPAMRPADAARKFVKEERAELDRAATKSEQIAATETTQARDKTRASNKARPSLIEAAPGAKPASGGIEAAQIVEFNPPAASMQPMLWSPWWTEFQGAGDKRGIDCRRGAVAAAAKQLFREGYSPTNAAIKLAEDFGSKSKSNGAAEAHDPAAIAAGAGGAFASVT